MASGYNPHQVDLSICALINFNGNSMSIREMVTEINIYHDLMANGLECELIISDALGVNELLPIVGDEAIYIKFKTPTFENVREYIFRVYDISNKTKTGQRADVYVIKGCSQEIVNNLRSSVNQSFRDIKAFDFVRSIYNEHLKAQPEDHYLIKKTKKLHVQETEQTHHFVFPGGRPINAINYAAREAKAKKSGNIIRYNYNDVQDGTVPSYDDPVAEASEASNFLFYESYDGWYFREIDSLLSQTYVAGTAGRKGKETSDVFDNFYLASPDLENDTKDEIRPYQKIVDIETVKQFNTLENIQHGQYQHTVEVIDPILKKFEEQEFVYDRDANKFFHVEKRNDRRIFANNSIFKDKIDTSHSFYFVSHLGQNYAKSSEYLKTNVFDPYPETVTDPQIVNSRKIQNWFSFDYVSRLQLNNVVLSVTIPGNTDLDIGSIVNLHLPQNSQDERYISERNVLYDQRFFVLAVRHTINRETDTFFTVFECVKDSYAVKVQEAGVKPI